MFFLPWATGIVIMVLCCIAGAVCLRFLPIWGGFLIGTALFYLWEAAMRVENIVSLALLMVVVPSLALGFWGIYLERKTGVCKSNLSLTIQVIITALIASPFTATIADFLLGFIDPRNHMSETVTELNNPDIIHLQLATWSTKIQEWEQARQILSWYEDKWIKIAIVAFLIYAVGRCIAECQKGLKKMKEHPIEK